MGIEEACVKEREGIDYGAISWYLKGTIDLCQYQDGGRLGTQAPVNQQSMNHPLRRVALHQFLLGELFFP